MSDLKRVLTELDQKHQAYTKKFAQFKARIAELHGELDELGARVQALESRPKGGKKP